MTTVYIIVNSFLSISTSLPNIFYDESFSFVRFDGVKVLTRAEPGNARTGGVVKVESFRTFVGIGDSVKEIKNGPESQWFGIYARADLI